MSVDPNTTEGRAELRKLAAKAKTATFEPGWPYDGTGDWTGCVDGMLGGITGEFAGAMSPDVVLSLIDALDEAECEVERQRGDLIIERRQGTAELRRAEKAEAALDRVQADLNKLMNDLHQTTEGLGSWHDGTEYLEWAGQQIREIWLRSKGLDKRGHALEGES